MIPKPPSPSLALQTLSHHPDAKSANAVPRAVVAFARTDRAGHVIARHSHERDQLVYAIKGVMSIEALNTVWTIPPSYGLWIPATVEHSVRMDTEVEMRTLYISSGVVPFPDNECQVRAISPLLRELIIRAVTISPLYDEYGPDGRLMQVIVDEIAQQVSAPLGLRFPSDKRLAELCQHVLDHLGESEPIGRLGSRVGLSERSVMRLFPQQTGMTFHAWRQQARLMRAFSLAEQNRPLGLIASELGYSSSAAFAKMFRRVFGASPRILLRATQGASVGSWKGRPWDDQHQGGV
ncbi:AraC family transcriptional regulator [Orrella marina]|uniref:AraC family transcriptional regulator n=1 Tax=Orrella marina TaxID=2163011 RepID=A0A2R4XJY0_9BURK|nr:helix-turn-helix transcriptional regulator [Orrella marina]AWB34135.1 AraC family transcriptional regulator [Orrella marina]